MIRFTAIDVPMPSLDFTRVRSWIQQVVSMNDCRVGELYYYFYSDEALLAVNRERLGHDFYTDIITFPLEEPDEMLSSEFCISVERVADNADAFGRSFENELHRVIIHGVLHLLGFDDYTDVDRAMMREQEEKCLNLLFK